MPLVTCSGCGTQVEIPTSRKYDGVVACKGCRQKISVTIANGEVVKSAPAIDRELLEGLTTPPIPADLYADYEDAVRCLGCGVPRAAAVMCRYTVQHALLARGAADGPPDKMVNAARQRGLLSEKAFRMCSTAVFIGGKGAHPQEQPADEVTNDDAKNSILATKTVLRELFTEG